MTEDIERDFHYTISVKPWYRGEMVSFLSGETLVAYGETPTEAKQRVEILLLKEIEDRDLTIIERLGPKPSPT